MAMRSRNLILLAFLAVSPLIAQNSATRPEATGEPLTPDWCKKLPRPGYKDLERVPVVTAWFEVYRVKPATFAIYEPHQYEEVISYLIVGNRRALLFDTGMGMGDLRRVVMQLTKLPITVLNSHTHFDHIGDNWQFSNIVGVDSDYTRRHESGGTHEELKDAALPERLCGTLPKGFDPSQYKIPTFKINAYVHEGQKIDLGGRILEVVMTPGHTPDALSLWDETNKLIFTGDSYYAGPIFLYVPETDLVAYGRSIGRLAKLADQAEAVLPSHNFPLERPQELARVAAAFHKIQTGKAKGVEENGVVEYDFGSFSFLLAK